MTIDGSTDGRIVGLRWMLAFAAAVGLADLTGCHHRRAQPVLLPPQTPVALVAVPEPQSEPLVEAQTPTLPAIPVAQSAGKLKKVKKRPPKTSAAAQQATTAAGQAKKAADAGGAVVAKVEPPVVEIGALTVGGEQSPRALQEANELIASNERRLNGISPDAIKAQAELVGKVRNFQKGAQVALTSGDAEGAKTLAMKGKLLLDDFDKAEGK